MYVEAQAWPITAVNIRIKPLLSLRPPGAPHHRGMVRTRGKWRAAVYSPRCYLGTDQRRRAKIFNRPLSARPAGGGGDPQSPRPGGHHMLCAGRAADEPRGKSGIAHFLEHLMFRHAAHPRRRFSARVRRVGGRSATSLDPPIISRRPGAFGHGLELEADRLRGIA